MVLSDLNFDFNASCYSKFPIFDNLYTFLTIKKFNGIFRTNSSSYTIQDKTEVWDIVNSEGKEIEIISGAQNILDVKEKMTMTLSIIKQHSKETFGKVIC